MAYLDNSSITVDAVLTKKGREILSKGATAFKITKFALADDEIDYGLWNPLHPSGSEYYGKVIENMPVLEALIDESQAMRYKLISIDDVTSTATTVQLPYIDFKNSNGASITHGTTIAEEIKTKNSVLEFTPTTKIIVDGKESTTGLDLISEGYGYTFLLNKNAADIINESKGMFTTIATNFEGVDTKNVTSGQSFSGDGDFTAVVRTGSKLKITTGTPAQITEGTVFTLPLTVIGNQTGVIFSVILSFTVNKT